MFVKNYEGFKLINLFILKKFREEIKFNDIISDNFFVIDYLLNGLYVKNEYYKFFDNKNYYIFLFDFLILNLIYIKENKLIDVEDNEIFNIFLKLGNNKEVNYNFSYFEDYMIDLDFLVRINFIVDNCNVIFFKKEFKLVFFCESEEKNYEFFIEKIK